MLAIGQQTERLIWLLGIALASGLIGHYFLYHLLLAVTTRTESSVDNLIVRRCYRPAQWILIVLGVRIALQVPFFAPDQKKSPELLPHVLSLLLIGAVSWLLIKVLYLLEDYILERFDVTARDNLRARKIHTQFRVIKQIAILAIGIIAFATMLMTFERVRQLGTTILASAGVIGIVVGMAAQRTIATVIAGLQIAVTQPIRVDDVVIVEGEWGRIEEITLTYVVVRIWDLRRLIVPITYFIETPFQNWTRISADILGTVYVYVDHTIPVEDIRKELQNILEQSEHWDKKVCVLQVTNTSERAVELRALMSASDASLAWTLRCEVREKLVAFLQKQYPQSLPRIRAELNQIELQNE